jgi:hypothetical protein
MKYKKGDVVQVFDRGHIKNATVIKNGVDFKNRVRVRLDNYPMDLSITLEENDNTYILP